MHCRLSCRIMRPIYNPPPARTDNQQSKSEPNQQSTISNLQSHRSLSSIAFPYFQRHVLALALSGRGGERAQRGRRPPLTSDHLAEIAWRDEQLNQGFVPVLRFRHAYLVGTIGQHLCEELYHRTD